MLYCAGIEDYTEWVQNCAQLAISFYSSNSRFGAAHVCLAAADEVCSRAAAAERPVDDDVAANVAVGWGKLQLQRLEVG